MGGGGEVPERPGHVRDAARAGGAEAGRAQDGPREGEGDPDEVGRAGLERADAQPPDELSEPLSRLAEKALAEKFAEQPIPLEGNSTLDNAAKSGLKSVTVSGGQVVVERGL